MANHIFICYARKDETFVLTLATQLKARGVPVWLDQWDIPPSADWDQTIDKAIESCAHFLIVLSPSATKSREVRGELRLALDENKPVLPLLFQPCRIPRQLRFIQYVDYSDRQPDDDATLGLVLKALGVTESKPTVVPAEVAPALGPQPELEPEEKRESEPTERPEGDPVQVLLKLSAMASHNNVQTGPDNILQALDGRPETRWSSWSVQSPGMWFELDLNDVCLMSGLALDTAGSANDYPRGYIVRVSTDRQQWQEVARNDRNDRALDVSFSPTPARYLRIEQTGTSDQWWWSIHGVNVRVR